MFPYKPFGATLAAAVVFVSAGYACAQEFSARLSGFEELGSLTAPTGAILSNGSGTLRLKLDRKAGTADFALTYSDVGTTPPKTGTVTQAHIHFGKKHGAGGIIVWLCGTATNPGPTGTPKCPGLNSGTMTGTLAQANVLAIATQNVEAGDFDALVDALTSDTAYANIHTTALPAGEIRGQVRKGHGDD
jgi:hypothetical protein